MTPIHSSSTPPVDTQNWRGNTSKKNYSGACEAYKNAIQHAPKEPFLHTKLDFVYLHLKEYEKAREHLERSLVLDPGYTEAYRYLGRVYIALNQYDDALATYRKLPTHKPEFADIYFNKEES